MNRVTCADLAFGSGGAQFNSNNNGQGQGQGSEYHLLVFSGRRSSLPHVSGPQLNESALFLIAVPSFDNEAIAQHAAQQSGGDTSMFQQAMQHAQHAGQSHESHPVDESLVQEQHQQACEFLFGEEFNGGYVGY